MLFLIGFALVCYIAWEVRRSGKSPTGLPLILAVALTLSAAAGCQPPPPQPLITVTCPYCRGVHCDRCPHCQGHPHEPNHWR